MFNQGDELRLRRNIESYYLPSQLINAISEIGSIPETSTETLVGIAFLDIADYTYLSKFLSSKENHIFLNGLYSAFNWVIKKHGGYLNKIEGDSIMFHYGGPIDPNVKDKDGEGTRKYIARELFLTCVELQRICSLFNKANESILTIINDAEAQETVKAAYEIISSLRNNEELSHSMNALFQVRIRIGASIGEVTIGNFGPDGARQWDVIGVPVIDAKRMESSAPAGGLRISSDYYHILESIGTLEQYYRRFQREATVHRSVYSQVSLEDVFDSHTIYIRGKKVSRYETYSVQVNPQLPEDTVEQIRLLLTKGEYGVDRILELLKYYRGNHFVMNKVEALCKELNVRVRKHEILKLLQPPLYEKILKKYKKAKDANKRAIEEIERKYSLFDLARILGKLQDALKFRDESDLNSHVDFISYEQYMGRKSKLTEGWFSNNKSPTFKTYYYYNVIYPLFFTHIKSSMLEYQASLDEIEEL
ncbi:MAG: adenylate/guanylate cyclase domain-containing protein [Spirochaetales bacterium]|nr:adenylate/guanylate cyclase domain-containing protein [Spirochaetales bacterium]